MKTGVAVVVLSIGLSATAAEIGVVGKKFIIVDKLSTAGKAKIVYVSKDQTAGITKGTSTNTSSISVVFDYTYDSAVGRIDIGSGEFNGTIGWKTNRATVAKFVNRSAPDEGTVAKVAVVKPGKLLKIVAKGLGDPPGVIDIVTAGAPTGDVHTACLVDNGQDESIHCSTFTGCAYKLIAAGTGAKLVCKTSTADPTCAALGSPSGAFVD